MSLMAYLDPSLMHTNESDIIFEAVAEGMWPFRLKGISLWVDYDIDFHRYRVIAEVELLNGDRMTFQVVSQVEDVQVNFQEESLRIAREMMNGFRSREDYLIAPLIQLGDN